MLYRVEVNTGHGGFGFNNHTLLDAKNDIRDYVSRDAMRKLTSWIRHNKKASFAKFSFENVECTITNADYCYIAVL